MDFNVSLKERTVLIAGPFSSTVQNLIIGLTNVGADVAFLDQDANQATKFCANVTDQREVNPKLGRAIAIPVNMSERNQIKEAVGQVAQSFGSVDIYLDAMLMNKPTPMNLQGDESDIDQIITWNLKTTLLLTQTVVPFLRGRKRGRIIYLMNNSILAGSYADLYASAARSGLVHFAKNLARQVSELSMTVNVLALGLTEEYVLAQSPAGPSIREAIEKMKLIDPHIKLTEPDKISNSVIYLASQLGNAVSGQLITLT
jgi:3-oxoacyl-[acyl-carrier protein] reductase